MEPVLKRTTKRCFSLIFGLAGLLLVASVPAQVTNSPLGSTLVVRSWGTRAGLPQNTINAITRTRDGYLWLGTQDGLARFDGLRFTTFGLEEGLQSVEIQTLLEDGEGSLWIGTRGGGLSRFAKGHMETFPLPSQIQAGNTITCLAEDVSGLLWIGTGSGLTFWARGEFVKLPGCGILERLPIRALLKDRSGGMWIATSYDGLYEYRDGKLSYREGPTGVPKVLAYCLTEDRQGRLWAGIGNGQLLRLDGESWRVFTQADGVPYAYITCLAEDQDGHIWAGSLDDGLYCLQGERFEALRKADGLTANDIRSLYPSPSGELWVGTRTGGLNQVRRRRLFCVASAEGLTNEFTRSVSQTADGSIWVGTLGNGVFRGTPSAFEHYSVSPIMDFYASVESVLAASDGSVWLGGARSLLQVQRDKISACYTNESWIQSSWVTALCEDPRGGIWAGTQLGQLVHILNQSARTINFSIARGSVTALATQPDGSLWVGSTAGGLIWIPPGSEKVFTITNGLLSKSVRTLYRDARGVLWIGTAGGGLSRWEAGKVFTYSSQHGLNAKTVLQIVEDGLGYLWLGCSRGILRVGKKDLEEVAEGQRPYLHPLTFGANDGMLAEECTGGFTPAGLRTREGLICISTVRGLVFIDPRLPETHVELPRVWIENARLSGAAAPLKLAGQNDLLELRAGQREIEIQYTGIDFSAPEAVRFRYRMEGFDQDWVEAGTRRTAYYRLPAGDFRFQVKACNSEGVWTEDGPSLAIVARPFVWETAWFKLLLGVALIGGFAGFLRYAEKRQYQRQLEALRTQHAIERERLRISKDMHDDIGSTLTQVAQLTELTRGEPGLPPPAQHQLERIRLQARAAVQALDEIVWATNPKNDNLPQFAEYLCRFADECFELSSARCWVEVPTVLPLIPLSADLRHNVFLAVKESFNNILKHSGAPEAWLRLRLTAESMELEIEDSGQGFVPSEPVPGSNRGNGLRNMRSRIAECGGTAEITSIVGRGTRVRFVVPLTELRQVVKPGNPNVV